LSHLPCGASATGSWSNPHQDVEIRADKEKRAGLLYFQAATSVLAINRCATGVSRHNPASTPRSAGPRHLFHVPVAPQLTAARDVRGEGGQSRPQASSESVMSDVNSIELDLYVRDTSSYRPATFEETLHAARRVLAPSDFGRVDHCARPNWSRNTCALRWQQKSTRSSVSSDLMHAIAYWAWWSCFGGPSMGLRSTPGKL